MTTFARFDDCLAQQVSTDYWYDVEDETAQELLEAFDDDDWQRLASAWPQRPSLWQARLLLALRAAPQRSAPLLRELVLACDADDLDTAVDTLNMLPDTELGDALDGRGQARLTGHAARSSIAATLAALLERHARLAR